MDDASVICCMAEKDEASMIEVTLERDRMIIARIYDLLPTVKEVLQQVSTSVDHLAFDEARELFENATVAIKKISENLLSLRIDHDKYFLPLMKKMRLIISSVSAMWERDRPIEGQKILNNHLIPCYIQWNECVVSFLSGDEFIYLQN